MADFRPCEKQDALTQEIRILEIIASDEDIYSLNGKTQGVWTPQSPPCAIGLPCWHHIHYTNEPVTFEVHIIYFIYYMYIYLTTGPHIWIHFYLHLPNFTTFLFCLPPHFHLSCFVLSSFVLCSFIWLLSLSWILTIFPTHKARLGPYIFIYLQSE